jgi:serine/threonine-protein kinase
VKQNPAASSPGYATLSPHESHTRPVRRAASTLPSLGDAGVAVAIEHDMQFRRGDRIGASYLVEDVVGEGAAGIVLRATDTRLQRRVAIKVLRAHWPDGDDPWQLIGEARAMARVRHRNVVAVHALEPGPPAPHIVMEHVDGVDLARWLEREGVPAVDVALALLSQICAGVAAVHAAGVVHFDLKPSNVLIDRAYQAVVTDFGLAQMVGLANGELGGTPYYLAPEVASGEVAAGHAPRADVYALGLLAVELLTGQHPIRARDVAGVMRAKLAGMLRAPSELRPELGTNFDEPIARAVALDPRVRWGGPLDFWRAMRAVRDDVAARAPRPRVLLVDGDDGFCDFADGVLREQHDALVYRVATGAEAVAHARGGRVDLMVLDPSLDDMNGVELIATVANELGREAPAMLVASGDASMADWRLMARLGAASLLCKPVDALQLADAARSALLLRRARWPQRRSLAAG